VSNIEISPEDRERLAKSKFQEWANEWFAEAGPAQFKTWFEEARNEARKAQPGQPVQPQATPEQPLPRPQRKRSLLEECFSQTFGF